MSPGQLKGIGVTLGLVVIVLATMHFLATFRSGTANWYLVVMICGMLLMIYYTISNVGRGRPRRRR